MKIAVFPLLLLLVASPVLAADPVAQPAVRGTVALADGVVKKIDKAGGRLTVAHGPLPNGMPAMTMPFRVAQAAWLDELVVGQSIRFATEEINGVTTITRLEKAR